MAQTVEPFSYHPKEHFGNESGMDRKSRDNWHASRIEEPKAVWKDEPHSCHSAFRPLRCLEICGGCREVVDLDVATDEVVSISLDGECVATPVALPVQLKEMAVGFLIGEGLVESMHDIASVREDNCSLICETLGGIDERKKRAADCRSRGGSAALISKQVRSDFKIEAATLLVAVDQLNDLARLWRRTGATHTSMICNSAGSILASCEDIGRSSSVDKAIGTALLAGIDLSKCALVTSGRLSSVIVAKAARAGFPVIVSRSAPMNSAVQTAEETGMTLGCICPQPKLVCIWKCREDNLVLMLSSLASCTEPFFHEAF